MTANTGRQASSKRRQRLDASRKQKLPLRRAPLAHSYATVRSTAACLRDCDAFTFLLVDGTPQPNRQIADAARQATAGTLAWMPWMPLPSPRPTIPRPGIHLTACAALPDNGREDENPRARNRELLSRMRRSTPQVQKVVYAEECGTKYTRLLSLGGPADADEGGYRHQTTLSQHSAVVLTNGSFGHPCPSTAGSFLIGLVAAILLFTVLRHGCVNLAMLDHSTTSLGDRPLTCTSSQEVPSFRFVRPTRYSGNRERKRESRKRRPGRSGVRRQRLCDAAADAHDRCYCWGRGKKTPTTATPSPPWGLSQLPALFTAAKKKEKTIAGRTTAHNIDVYGHARSGSANCPATFVMIPQLWFCQAHLWLCGRARSW